MVSRDEVLAFARRCKQQRPEITEAELRAFLESKFVRGVDPLAEAASRGATESTPIHDWDSWFYRTWENWLWGLSKGITRWWTSPVVDVAAIKNIIDGVIATLRAETDPGAAAV